MAPVVHALQRASGVHPVVCVTDQHRELVDGMLEFFGVSVDHRLGVMKRNQTPTDVAARVLDRLPAVFEQVRPAAVLVQGDTTTTLAASLAAFYARIPVGHVEAGLRTYRLDAPFPEEANRQLTTVMTRWHFAATTWARDNLRREGVPQARIVVTGNPVVDALRWSRRRLGRAPSLAPLPTIRRGQRLVLVTAHRRENFGAPFQELCGALRALVERNPEVELLYPVHPNPNVRRPVQELLANAPRVHLLPPLDYWSLIRVLERAHFVLTDSGGIQEEAPALGKPVLVMRDVTERPEGVHAGTARLVGTSKARILRESERLLRNTTAHARMARAHNPFGDGRAATRIARTLAGALRKS